jgi:SEC-C motif-containing protein
MTSQICPCNALQETKKELSACCGPILAGKKKAATAEELLRARYTAFTQGDVDFIMKTHHSRTVHEIKREEIEDWAKNSEWQGLQIAQIDDGKDEKGKADENKATIAFCARYTAAGKAQEHWEQSYFEKEKGEWRFLDAKGIHVGTFRRTEPKVGRNDVCPCGSGKKFKKCCASAA